MTERPRILLVDDDRLIRQSLNINLRREGFLVKAAASGREALGRLVEEPFDLLLTDFLMEGMTGLDLCVQAKRRHPHLKVIVFSGFDDLGSPEDIGGHGVDAFVGKPIEFDALVERITEVWAGEERGRGT